jgi:hypothetical protein
MAGTWRGLRSLRGVARIPECLAEGCGARLSGRIDPRPSSAKIDRGWAQRRTLPAADDLSQGVFRNIRRIMPEARAL